MKNLIVKILVISSLVTGAAFAGENCQKNATAEKKVLDSDKTKTAETKDTTVTKGK